MPTQLQQNNVLEVTYHAYSGGQAGLMVWHFNILSAPATPIDEAGLANQMYFDVRPGYQALLHASTSLRGVAWRKIFPAPVSASFNSTDPAVNGVGLGDLLPKQTAGLLSKRTSAIGRHGRGRAYVPFPSEGDNSVLGVPSAPYITLLTNLAIVFSGVRSYTIPAPNGGVVAGNFGLFDKTAFSFSTLNQLVPRPIWATQRRRGDFGASNAPPF